MRIGDLQVDGLIDGEAVVPKEQLYGGAEPPTEADWEPYAGYLDACTGHQINTVGCFLIRNGDKVVLNDTGFGPGSVGLFSGGGLRSTLWAADVSPLEVTDVIYSHLHVDHIGWTTLGGRPYFPNATLWIDRRDWEHYAAPDYRLEEWETYVTPENGTVAERFAPVQDRLSLFEPDTEILPGIRALEASGHTPGNTVFELVSAGERGVLIGDLAHTQGELVHGWDLAFNGDHARALAAIEHFRRYLYDEKLPFAAAHFPGLRWGRLTGNGRPGGVTYETI